MQRIGHRHAKIQRRPCNAGTWRVGIAGNRQPRRDARLAAHYASLRADRRIDLTDDEEWAPKTFSCHRHALFSQQQLSSNGPTLPPDEELRWTLEANCCGENGDNRTLREWCICRHRLVNHGQEHVSVAVDEAHLSLAGHFDLIEIHFQDFSRMLNLAIYWFTTQDIENFHTLWIAWVDDCQDIRAERNMSLIEEFNTKSLLFWRWDQFSFIWIDGKVLACID